MHILTFPVTALMLIDNLFSTFRTYNQKYRFLISIDIFPWDHTIDIEEPSMNSISSAVNNDLLTPTLAS